MFTNGAKSGTILYLLNAQVCFYNTNRYVHICMCTIVHLKLLMQNLKYMTLLDENRKLKYHHHHYIANKVFTLCIYLMIDHHN